MNASEFIAKWSRTALPERAASQEHFLDLCRLLGQPTPAEHDASGSEYTFEKGVTVTDAASQGAKGHYGYADAWWRGKFAWEYKRKGKYKDLRQAYRQLCQYREALENPPLLVVCDIARTEIHTNFTGTAKQVHTIELAELDQPERLKLLRRVFTDPASFQPDVTKEQVTREAAKQIGLIAQGLHARGHDPHTAAHFLMKCMFCLFAEDVTLLPDELFTRLLQQWKDTPSELTGLLTELFAKMRTGGAFGTERIAWFNGGLFDESPALPLTGPEVGELLLAAHKDWSSVEPAIFGTLFERSLDPSKRAQIGAHYTSREDILLVIEPVIMAPLRRRWQAARDEVDKQLARRTKATTPATKRKANAAIEAELRGFLEQLGHLRILDPACGSGNFLYVAIQELLDLEKEVITHAARPEIGLGLLPTVRPTQLHGLEINPYAAELAQVVIWIGYLQWMTDNGFNAPRDPILEPLQTIECRDAILAWTDEDGKPIPEWREGAQCQGPAEWPKANFIVGNPPFLGCRQMRRFGLSDQYIECMHDSHGIANTSDLCCYWFEEARGHIQRDPSIRVGLLATQGIRGPDNRNVLDLICSTGAIFMAWADRPWVLDGADVRVSIVGFGASTGHVVLDGQAVDQIHSDLSSGIEVTLAKPLGENAGLAFMGTTKGGEFEVQWSEAVQLLRSPNPNGRSNFDVLRPWHNATDEVRRCRGLWIIDIPPAMGIEAASQYEKPFERLREMVYPTRRENRRESYARYWWRHVEARPALRDATAGLSRKVATPRVAKHRLFAWEDAPVLPDSRIFVFARSDDYFFAVLHSSVHEIWSLARASRHGVGDDPTYNTSTCFETFPLPWPPGEEPTPAEAPHASESEESSIYNRQSTIHSRISAAAAALNEQRQRWLNPPEWIDPITRQVDARDDFADVPEEARALIRQSAIQAEAAQDPNLKKRTLTNLYNQRPTWLQLAHLELDQAVLSAYAATDGEGNWDPEWSQVWQPTGPGQPLPEDHELAEQRKEIDQKVLANLLRLNQERAGEDRE